MINGPEKIAYFRYSGNFYQFLVDLFFNNILQSNYSFSELLFKAREMISWLTIFITFVALPNGELYLHKRHRIQKRSDTLCSTPNSQPGICLPIDECQEMEPIFEEAPYDTEASEFLLRSRCNFDDLNLICCPRVKLADRNQQQNVLMNIEDQSILSPPDCGKTLVKQTSRIVGGEPTELDAWPWIALLGYKVENNPKLLWFCGGAMANDRYVITAAHCIITDHLGLQLVNVRLGENELDGDFNDHGKVDIGIDSVIAHPDFNFETKLNDIGLIKLEKSIGHLDFVNPICLPKTLEMRRDDYVGSLPFVAGWGATSEDGPASKQLLQLQIPVLQNNVCKSIYEPKGAKIIDHQLCAGYLEGGKDTCQGDSGGPLMLLNGNFYYIIGVVSYGYGCANIGYPGIYTRITSYYDWLVKYLSEEKYKK